MFATVKASRFSGHGHRLGNLLPSCKRCNSAKGNKEWRCFLAGLGLSPSAHEEAERNITAYLANFSYLDPVPENSPAYERFQQIRSDVLDLLAEADQIARLIREQAIDFKR